MVDASLIDRQAAVVLRLDDAENLVPRRVGIQRRHIHARGQNAFHREVAELQGGGDQFALFFVQASFFRHVLDDVIELVLGDGKLGLSPPQLRGRCADL